MIGIGMPISQSRMERMTSLSSLPARAAQWLGWRNGSRRLTRNVRRRILGVVFAPAEYRRAQHDRSRV